MPKLTDIQLVILSAAAKRDDGLILPLPKQLKLEPDAASGIFKALIKKKLVAEQPATGAETSWRDNGDGQPLMLVITKGGLRAISAEPAEDGGPERELLGSGRGAAERRRSRPHRASLAWAGQPRRLPPRPRPGPARTPSWPR